MGVQDDSAAPGSPRPSFWYCRRRGRQPKAQKSSKAVEQGGTGSDPCSSLLGKIPFDWLPSPTSLHARYENTVHNQSRLLGEASYAGGHTYRIFQGIALATVTDLQSQQVIAPRHLTVRTFRSVAFRDPMSSFCRMLARRLIRAAKPFG
jgi:hypothetical protein